MLSWLNKKEHEINTLAGCLNSMKEIPFVASPNDLNAIVYNIEYDFVLCFSFLVTSQDDAYLQLLSDYLQAPKLKQGFDDALPKQWHEDRTMVHHMRSQAKQFKEFFKANKMQQDMTFIASDCVGLESHDIKGAVTILFKEG